MREGSNRAQADQGAAGDGPAPTGTTGAAYRGFLFADLRGFTAFVESHGDNAAADLLDAYRGLVREEVARHAGAEIRTEGDSFYVVFASARAAVACGLGIIAAAGMYSERHADRPIRVGIGINAGETIQRSEGFVGAAVNLAARVCSQARAGEVLVTGTVREAVRGSSDVRFAARGSRRLKGIAESVPLFALESTAAGGSRSINSWAAPRRLGRVVAAMGATAVIAVALGLTLREGGLGGRGTSPSAALAASDGLTAGPRASVSSVATVGPTSDEFPNADEAALLSRIDEDIVEYCGRADPNERPRFRVDPETAAMYGLGSTNVPLAGDAGVACSIPSSTAPSVVYYWSTSSFLDLGAVALAEVQILNEAGTYDIERGGCAFGAPAFGEWTFGGASGWILCREVFGDAILEWSYDGLPMVGVAVRRDGDHAKLYSWWRDGARFLRD